MGHLNGIPKREFSSRSELRDWLAENHATGTSFWLVSFKKHIADRYVPYGEIVEELLCFGWIDSRTRRLDDDRTMLLVGPRKYGSTWSASNKERVSRLAQHRLMTPAGQVKVDEAKRDGSWSYLDDIDKLVIPDDLGGALERNKAAKQNFDAFSDSAKKVILLWIKNAKREATRAKRVSETARLAAKGVKAAHPEARGQ